MASAGVVRITLSGSALSSYLANGGTPGTFSVLPTLTSSKSTSSSTASQSTPTPASVSTRAMSTSSPSTVASSMSATSTSASSKSSKTSARTSSTHASSTSSQGLTPSEANAQAASSSQAAATASSHGPNVGLIVGVVIGAAVLIALVILLLLLIRRRQTKRREEESKFEKALRNHPSNSSLRPVLAPVTNEKYRAGPNGNTRNAPGFEFGELRVPSPVSSRSDGMPTNNQGYDMDGVGDFPQPPPMSKRRAESPTIPQLPHMANLSPLQMYTSNMGEERPMSPRYMSPRPMSPRPMSPRTRQMQGNLGPSIDPRRDEKVSPLREGLFRKLSRSKTLGRKRAADNPFHDPPNGQAMVMMPPREQDREYRRMMRNGNDPRQPVPRQQRPPRGYPGQQVRQQGQYGPIPHYMARVPPLLTGDRRQRQRRSPNGGASAPTRAKRAYRRDMDMESEWTGSTVEKSESERSVGESILQMDEEGLKRQPSNPFETTQEKAANPAPEADTEPLVAPPLQASSSSAPTPASEPAPATSSGLAPPSAEQEYKSATLSVVNLFDDKSEEEPPKRE